MVIFHSLVAVYQRVIPNVSTTSLCGGNPATAFARDGPMESLARRKNPKLMDIKIEESLIIIAIIYKIHESSLKMDIKIIFII